MPGRCTHTLLHTVMCLLCCGNTRWPAPPPVRQQATKLVPNSAPLLCLLSKGLPLHGICPCLQQQLHQVQHCCIMAWHCCGAHSQDECRAAITLCCHARTCLHQALCTLHMACRDDKNMQSDTARHEHTHTHVLTNIDSRRCSSKASPCWQHVMSCDG